MEEHNESLSNLQISEYYREVLETPSFVSRLDDYEKEKVLNYSERIIREAHEFANSIVIANPKYQYPVAYKGREVQYWLDTQQKYREANKVKQAIIA